MFKQLRGWVGDPAFPHWLMIVFCGGALLMAFLLQPTRPGDEVVSFNGEPIPPVCGMKRTTGLDCPGCGLTRSWVAAAHGQISNSLHFHRLGWLVMLSAVFQLVRHSLWLARPDARKSVDLWGKRLDMSLVPLGVLLIINWMVTIYQIFA